MRPLFVLRLKRNKTLEPVWTLLLVVTLYSGFVFPPIGVAMSWREWLRIKCIPPQTSWRRMASMAALTLLTICVSLWAYAVVQELRQHYSYVYRSAQIGRWSSVAVFAISLGAESKLRRYLLIGALGLVSFFAISIGDLP